MNALYPGLAALSITVALFLLFLVIYGVFVRAYEQYQERYVVRSLDDLGNMFLFIDPRQLLMMNMATMVLLGLLAYVIFNGLLAIFATIFGFFLPMILIKQFRKRRIRLFNAQLVDALQGMSNAFKAGLTFQQAVEFIAKDAPSPLGQEFTLYVREVKLGVPLDQALLNMAARVGSEDLDLVAVSTNIARQLGGNMSEMFETLSGTIRERFRLEGKIAAMTAQGKLQGWVVAAMPIILGMIVNYQRPDLMQPLMNSYWGYLMVGVVAVMEVLGMLIIRRIVNIDI
ncbi:MAG: type II secretion system F family protein [Cystobacterineae bacterium]|nr:type II secretion system F family protein [Cystobacterineae bacterium]